MQHCFALDVADETSRMLTREEINICSLFKKVFWEAFPVAQLTAESF